MGHDGGANYTVLDSLTIQLFAVGIALVVLPVALTILSHARFLKSSINRRYKCLVQCEAATGRGYSILASIGKLPRMPVQNG
jgi:hypothetical protein